MVGGNPTFFRRHDLWWLLRANNLLVYKKLRILILLFEVFTNGDEVDYFVGKANSFGEEHQLSHFKLYKNCFKGNRWFAGTLRWGILRLDGIFLMVPLSELASEGFWRLLPSSWDLPKLVPQEPPRSGALSGQASQVQPARNPVLALFQKMTLGHLDKTCPN